MGATMPRRRSRRGVDTPEMAPLTNSISIEGAAGLVRGADGSLEIAGPIELELSEPTGDGAHDDIEMRIDGTYITSARIRVRSSGGSWRVAVTPTDVDLRLRELKHRATHDTLTGLANRASFMSSVELVLQRARSSPTRPVVFFVDLDDFKRVNDTFGHETGDRLLVVVAGRLRTASRPMDTVGRLAGDEFVVLCEGLTDQAIAHRIAGRIIVALASIVDLGGLQLTASASVGVAMAEDGINAEELIRRADVAMFRAKGSGLSVVHYDVETDRAIADADGPSQTDVADAVEANRLVLRYQTIRTVADRRLAGVRPLAYVQDSSGELKALSATLDRLGSPALTAQAGRWVIQRAVMHLAEMRRQDEAKLPRLHLALRANEVLDAGVVGIVTTELDRAGLDPSSVVLEVTGNLLGLRATDVAVPALHATGVRLAIEGFGRGRSSLSMLEIQAAELMRLDPALTEGIVTDERRRRTLGALIELAHANGMLAITTGVRSHEELDVLAALDCDLAEGPVFGPELAFDDLA